MLTVIDYNSGEQIDDGRGGRGPDTDPRQALDEDCHSEIKYVSKRVLCSQYDAHSIVGGELEKPRDREKKRCGTGPGGVCAIVCITLHSTIA